MKFTDIFVRRPVLSCVVSLLILVVGLAGLFSLTVRQYPKMSNTTITITTVFPGAGSETVKGFITEPIQHAVATTEGIDYISSTSSDGQSQVTVRMKLGSDANAALTEITGKVSAIRYQLPATAEPPSIRKSTGQTFPELILAFTSQSMSSQQVTAYINRVISPKLANVSGVAEVSVWGGDDYAMRIWLNPQRMAALRVTPAEVLQALKTSNVQVQAGDVRDRYQKVAITGGTQLSTPADFKQIIIKRNGPQLVTVGDVARVELGPRHVDRYVLYNNKRAYFGAVQLTPDANPLAVVGNVLKLLPEIRQQLPKGLHVTTLYDATTYISSALDEVVHTLLEAGVIVVVVVFLCLGSLRAVLIPVVTIPLSLIGVCFLMKCLGFSLNLLTFLSMVLAIGLVVDDAIVVVENIYRHLEEGKQPLDAALEGAREIASPVIVMTLTLAAVYAPIGFIGGITGALFKEFAFTLAASVIISGVVALTFSPMLCSKLLNRDAMHTKAAQMVDHVFGHMQASYIRLLSGVMQARSAIVIMVVAVIINIVVFYGLTAKELAPQEDEGFLGVIATAPNGATLDYLKAYNESIGRVFNQFPQVASTMIIDGHPSANQILAGMVLKDWSDRKQTQMQLKTPLQLKLNDIPGMKAFAFQPASLPGSGGSFPINFVLNTTMDMQQLFAAMETLKELAMRSGLFMFLQPDLHFDTPQLSIEIDRKKAADLGITTQDVASALSIMVGDQRANRFTVLGYSYEVVPQVDPQFRANSHELGNIYLGTNTGQLIPMSSVVKYRGHNQPDVLNQFQQLNSVTLSGVPMPGVSLGYALNYLATTAQAALPKAIGVGYTGQSRQYMQEGNTLLLAFAFSVIIIFLLLSAQFESFRDPFIILLTVPMCLFGALTPLFLGLATINIYTQIGMITLVGLISKHGILIVSCANDLRLQGKTKSEAILAAAEQRLRPVLMTTGAMVFGVVPLLFASGAGAVSRFDLGLVITSGMLVGTCFTLLVVPVFYSLFSYRDANLNSI